MVFACDDRVSGGPMGRYTRLALAEREEIVLLRCGGGKLRRDGRSDGRGQSDRQQGDGRKLVRRWLGAVPSCIGRPAWLVFCQVVIGQCGVSFPSEKAVGFSPVRNWPVIARVLLFHCIRA